MGEGAEVEHACERRWNMHARVGGQDRVSMTSGGGGETSQEKITEV